VQIMIDAGRMGAIAVKKGPGRELSFGKPVKIDGAYVCQARVSVTP
jgi:hypothetical protein